MCKLCCFLFIPGSGFKRLRISDFDSEVGAFLGRKGNYYTIGLYRELCWDNGKEHGNCYMELRWISG